jgi:aminocarboxymuconate-semialdehyde decarboxylase
MPAETTLAICSMIFGGVLERLPKLKICFAHGGGSFACTLGRIEHGFNARPDLVAIRNKKNPREYLNRIYVDSLSHDPDVLKLLLKTFGENRVMLGSDYPFPLGEDLPGAMVDSMNDLDERVKRMVLGENTLELLGLSKDKFL